jgi:hypothetical protein
MPNAGCRTRRETGLSVIISWLLSVGLIRSAPAQTPGTPGAAQPPTIEVTAAARLRGSALRRLLLGARYRELWTAPFRAELLDISSLAGGLAPVRVLDGLSGHVLLLRAPEGCEYTFAPMDRSPAGPEGEVSGAPLLEASVPDQLSASHPAAPLVAARLRAAAGVPGAEPRLVVLADSGRLGEFAAEFSAVPGFLEERLVGCVAKMAGAGRAPVVIRTDSLRARMARSPADSADTRAYLTARLLDLFMGDWSRNPAGWRWVRGRDSTAAWAPMPVGSTQALASYEGLVLTGTRFIEGRLVRFNGSYPGVLNLTWNSRRLDRRLLAGLAHPVWDSIAAGLRSRLTDTIIAEAVGSMPPEYRRLDSLRLSDALRRRRDDLPRISGQFYRLLATEVDVPATERPEVAVVTRLPADTLDLRIFLAGDEGADSTLVPWFERRFVSPETREVRLHLKDLSDRAIVRGERTGRIVLRVIGDSARRQLTDSTDGATVFHGPPSRRWLARTRATVAGASSDSLFGPTKWRDWGSAKSFTPWVDQGADIGIFLGLGATFTRYGFRAVPFNWRVRFRAGWAFKAATYRSELQAWHPVTDSRVTLTMRLRASGIDILHYYGFGNETSNEQPEAFYKLRQEQFTAEPGVIVGLSPHDSLTLMVSARYATTTLDPNQLIGQDRPYGSGDFGQVGLGLAYAYDSRDDRQIPTRGVRLRAAARLSPAVWDVRSTFGSLEGTAATYFGLHLGVPGTVALQAGGKRVWGDYPFNEAAAIGGSTTVRGLTWQRYIGDASLYGNAELRMTLGHPLGLGTAGVFGLLDVGRVFIKGEQSRRWHAGYGPGIWLAPLSPRNNLSLALAYAEGRLGVELKAGFQF